MFLFIQTIVLISATIVLGNFLLFAVINLKNKFKNDLEKYTFYFWMSVLPIFVIGMNVKNLRLIPFVTILSMFTVKAFRNFWCGPNYKTKREFFVVASSVLLFGLGLYLYKYNSSQFLYAIAISAGLNFYLCEVIYCASKEIKATSVYERILLFTLFIGLYNNVSPILGQTNIIFDAIGWSTALILYQFVSMLMPLIILEHRKNSEKENLEIAVAQKTKELVLEKLEISKKHKEATILSKENQSLFNTLSHDIATPILAVDLYLNKITKNSTEESVQNISKNAIKHIDTIKGLIRSTKAQRLLNANKTPDLLQPVDISDSISKSIEINQVFLDKKNIKIFFENDLQDEDTFLADRSVFILSIMGNILSNAIKFSPVDSLIHIEAYKSEGTIIVEIQDSGTGIDLEKISELKARGFTSSESGTSGEQGSGFGLASTYQYVLKYKGDLNFLNNEFGALATLSFPLAESLAKTSLVQSPSLDL